MPEWKDACAYLARIHTHTQVHTNSALHGCMHVYIHGDNWPEPCSADGIAMTSASEAHSVAIGSSITWNGTWFLIPS